MSDDCCSADACVPHAHEAPAAAPRAWRDARLGRAAAGALLIGGGLLGDHFLHHAAATAAFLAAVALAIQTPATRAWRSLGARSLDINVLMVAAVCGAAALGDWAEAAAVVWLFDVSQWLEAMSSAHARHAIRSLMSVAPSEAVVRRNGHDVRVPASALRVGDRVVVRPGDRVPADGIVQSGDSAMDESPITGESLPVEKSIGDAVYSGAINGTGALEIDVRALAADSMAARIIHLVEAAQARRAPMQSFVDAFARRYTPAVVALAVLLAVVPPLVAGGAWGAWGYRALVLLVVACPCALVISTPVAVVSAVTSAARHGVLIKGGAALERAAGIRCIAFDKTGTLTRGQVTVAGIFGEPGHSAAGVLSVAASLEARSEHPIGRAIVNRARTDGVAAAPGAQFRALPGLGAEALVDEAPALVGSHRLFEERRLCTPTLHARFEELSERGSSAVFVGHDGAGLGVIEVSDELRESAREAMSELRRAGIARVVLVTGDLRASADTVGRAFALDAVHADLLPQDKVEVIAALRADVGPVAMVGDGINDAPALAAADLGVAMGLSGSGAALETADVTLMADELHKLPYVIRLGRRTRATVRANVGIALGLKLAFIALAAAGVATLWMAVLADTGASLVVTANGLRMLRSK